MAVRRGLSADDLEALYQRHGEALLGFFARRSFDAETAFDLTAETFARACEKRRSFRGSVDEEAAGWLYAIARNQLNDYARRGKARQRALHRLGLERPEPSEEELLRVEEMAGLSDMRSALVAALAELDPAQRRAIELRVLEELPYPEVARRLEVSEPTARARVSRGLRGLAAILETSEGGV
jgi:RNA polymerase sigma factor (sigma-70 family)